MIVNQIVKLNLESRTAELKAKGESERNIAAILSTESNQKISQPCVHRYLAGNTKLMQQAVESSSKLKVRVAELELDTIEARHELIREIRDLAQQAKESGDIRTGITGLDKAVAALDSLDKRLGRFTGQPGVQVNVGGQIIQAPQLREILKEFQYQELEA